MEKKTVNWRDGLVKWAQDNLGLEQKTQQDAKQMMQNLRTEPKEQAPEKTGPVEDSSRDIRYVGRGRGSLRTGEEAAMQAAKKLSDMMHGMRVPVLNQRYESMNVRAWGKFDTVAEGFAKFAVTFLDGQGTIREVYIPMRIQAGKAIDPEYFEDSIGRRFAFSPEGFTTLVEHYDEGKNQPDESIWNPGGTEEALAASGKGMRKKADNLDAVRKDIVEYTKKAVEQMLGDYEYTAEEKESIEEELEALPVAISDATTIEEFVGAVNNIISDDRESSEIVDQAFSHNVSASAKKADLETTPAEIKAIKKLKADAWREFGEEMSDPVERRQKAIAYIKSHLKEDYGYDVGEELIELEAFGRMRVMAKKDEKGESNSAEEIAKRLNDPGLPGRLKAKREELDKRLAPYEEETQRRMKGKEAAKKDDKAEEGSGSVVKDFESAFRHMYEVFAKDEIFNKLPRKEKLYFLMDRVKKSFKALDRLEGKEGEIAETALGDIEDPDEYDMEGELHETGPGANKLDEAQAPVASVEMAGEPPVKEAMKKKALMGPDVYMDASELASGLMETMPESQVIVELLHEYDGMTVEEAQEAINMIKNVDYQPEEENVLIGEKVSFLGQDSMYADGFALKAGTQGTVTTRFADGNYAVAWEGQKVAGMGMPMARKVMAHQICRASMDEKVRVARQEYRRIIIAEAYAAEKNEGFSIAASFMNEADRAPFRRLIWAMKDRLNVNGPVTAALDRYADKIAASMPQYTKLATASKIDGYVAKAKARTAAQGPLKVDDLEQEIQPKNCPKAKVRHIDTNKKDESQPDNVPGGMNIREFNDMGKLNSDPSEWAGHNFASLKHRADRPAGPHVTTRVYEKIQAMDYEQLGDYIIEQYREKMGVGDSEQIGQMKMMMEAMKAQAPNYMDLMRKEALELASKAPMYVKTETGITTPAATGPTIPELLKEMPRPTADTVIDRYLRIKEMPDGPEKQRAMEELDEMSTQIKGSLLGMFIREATVKALEVK